MRDSCLQELSSTHPLSPLRPPRVSKETFDRGVFVPVSAVEASTRDPCLRIGVCALTRQELCHRLVSLTFRDQAVPSF